MPAPPTLTLISLDEGQDTSLMSLTAGAGASSARVAAARDQISGVTSVRCKMDPKAECQDDLGRQ